MVAGISRVVARTAATYNALGALAWVGSLVVMGFTLGDIPLVNQHIETAIIIVVIVTSLPFPIELLREYLKSRKS
jgi:membrane-associated protein